MREKLLEDIEKISHETLGFRWEGINKLSERELGFLVALLSKAYLHERALLNIFGGDVTKMEALLDKVAGLEDIEVRYENVG